MNVGIVVRTEESGKIASRTPAGSGSPGLVGRSFSWSRAGAPNPGEELLVLRALPDRDEVGVVLQFGDPGRHFEEAGRLGLPQEFEGTVGGVVRTPVPFGGGQ